MVCRQTHGGSNVMLIAVIVLGALVLAPLSASAEWYADFYLGGAFTSDEDVKVKTIPPPDATLKGFEFDSAFTLGGRAGYWFDNFPLLEGRLSYGAGLDIFYFSPDTDFQIVNTTFGPIPLAPLDISVVGIGFDLLRFRLPLQKSTQFPNGRLQPYVSLGPTVSIITVEDSFNEFPPGQEDTDASVGVKLDLGVTFMLTKQVGLFGGYRFTHASAEVELVDLAPTPPDQDTLEIDLNTHHLIFGATVAFDAP